MAVVERDRHFGRTTNYNYQCDGGCIQARERNLFQSTPRKFNEFIACCLLTLLTMTAISNPLSSRTSIAADPRNSIEEIFL
jgi:hypothetical protein